MVLTGFHRARGLLLAAAALCWAAAPASAQVSRPQGRAPLQVQAQRPPAGLGAITPSQGALDVNFPPTPVGETATATCAAQCFALGSGDNCDGSGDVAVDKSLSAPFDVINFRVTSGTGCSGTPVNLPVHLNSGEKLLFDFTFSPTIEGHFTDTLGLGGLTWTLSGSTPNATGCSPDTKTLCLNNNRFQVTADWRTSDGQAGMASVVRLTSDTGYLWFFSASNVEVVIKVLDGCGFDNHFWVFAGGLTNVRVVIHVLDTQTSMMQTYVNHLGTPFQPLQDTMAFPCP